MCTVSWVFNDGGYDLLVNRDELRSRLHAEPPRRFAYPEGERGGITLLAPVDGDAGGTWVSVNDAGLAICLLNRYPSREGVFASRGLLVRELAVYTAVDEVVSRLQDKAREGLVYRPFTLLVLTPDSAPAILLWDGELLARADLPDVPVLTSSSRLPVEVGPVRRRLWEQMFGQKGDALGLDDILAFHTSHDPERGARSPCMHREDARTVSLTHVRVTASSVAMAYADGPPCQAELGQPLTLIRRTTPLPRTLSPHAVPVV